GALGVDPDRQQLADEVRRHADALGEAARVQARRAELLAERLVPAAAAPALAARRVVVDDHAVARRHAAHARADLLDLGAQLVAEDGGDLARDPAVEDVRAADPARQHACDDLAVAGARVGVVVDAHLAHADRARDPHRQASSSAMLAAVGGAATPRSVTSAVTSPAGVTSNAGLRTAVPGGATVTPPKPRTSSAPRSSISIRSPSGSAASIDETGPAMTNGIPAARAASARP